MKVRSAGRAACECGYAIDGAVPERLCDLCGADVLRGWVAEERRLLMSLPAYADDVAVLLARTVERQTAAILAPGDSAFSDAVGVRRAAGRQLRRLARKRRETLVPSVRWHELAALAARSATTGVRLDAKKANRRGLGAAGLAELAVRADDELWREMTRTMDRRRGM